jgi:peroxiredoxin
MTIRIIIIILGCSMLFSCHTRNEPAPGNHKTLQVGSDAPDFYLPAVDGKFYSLASFREASVLVVVFTCNHCPTAQSYEDRIIRLTEAYGPRGVAVVAIMPNDPKALRVDELDFSDIGDSFDEMKFRAKEKHFNFPYLYDGDSQVVSKLYGPVATPHLFIFDRNRKLRYNGRFDDQEKHTGNPPHNDAINAIEDLLNNREVAVKTTKVFGCSIKWSDKRDWITKATQKWAAEPVSLGDIGEPDLRKLVSNHSGKLRLVNVWATWCGPCVAEFPDLVTIYRMYRDRDFEFVTISTDESDKKPKALQFLQKQQASNTNYIFSGNKYDLIEGIDPNWQGALPYTILVEPGGKIVYSREGPIDPAELKKTIVENHLIGRYP